MGHASSNNGCSCTLLASGLMDPYLPKWWIGLTSARKLGRGET